MVARQPRQCKFKLWIAMLLQRYLNSCVLLCKRYHNVSSVSVQHLSSCWTMTWGQWLPSNQDNENAKSILPNKKNLQTVIHTEQKRAQSKTWLYTSVYGSFHDTLINVHLLLSLDNGCLETETVNWKICSILRADCCHYMLFLILWFWSPHALHVATFWNI